METEGLTLKGWGCVYAGYMTIRRNPQQQLISYITIDIGL